MHPPLTFEVRLRCPLTATYDETGKVDFANEIRDAFGAYTKLIVSAGEFGSFFSIIVPISRWGHGIIDTFSNLLSHISASSPPVITILHTE